MKTVAWKDEPPELHPTLEGAIPGRHLERKKPGPDPYLQLTRPIINSPSAKIDLPRRGFGSVTFLCPCCGSTDRFGTRSGRLGECKRCPFIWPRQYDWRVFVDANTREGFRTLAEFEAQIGGEHEV